MSGSLSVPQLFGSCGWVANKGCWKLSYASEESLPEFCCKWQAGGSINHDRHQTIRQDPMPVGPGHRKLNDEMPVR